MTTARVLFCASLILALFGPHMAQAQSAKTWRLGMLDREPPSGACQERQSAVRSCRKSRRLGYREGENLVIEWRHTDGQPDRRSREAAALMAWKPDVVFTVSGTNAVALSDVGASVPIVVGKAATSSACAWPPRCRGPAAMSRDSNFFRRIWPSSGCKC